MVAQKKSIWATEHGCYTHLSSKEMGQYVMHRMRVEMPKLHEVVHDDYRLALPMLPTVELDKEMFFKFWMPFRDKKTGHVFHEPNYANYVFLNDMHIRKDDPFRHLGHLRACKLRSVNGCRISSRDEFMNMIKDLARKLPQDQAIFCIETEWADYGFDFPSGSRYDIEISPADDEFPFFLNQRMCVVGMHPKAKLDDTIRRILLSEKMILKSVRVHFADASVHDVSIDSADSMDEIDTYLSRGKAGSPVKWFTLSCEIPQNRKRIPINRKAQHAEVCSTELLGSEDIRSALSGINVYSKQENDREFSLWSHPIGKCTFDFVGGGNYVRIPFSLVLKDANGVHSKMFVGWSCEDEVNVFDCLRYRYLGADFSGLCIVGSRSQNYIVCDGIGFRLCDFIPHIEIVKVNEYPASERRNETWIVEKLRSAGAKRVSMEFLQQGWTNRNNMTARIPILNTGLPENNGYRITVDSTQPSPRIISMEDGNGNPCTLLKNGRINAVICHNANILDPRVPLISYESNDCLKYVVDGYLTVELFMGDQNKLRNPVQPLITIVGDQKPDDIAYAGFNREYSKYTYCTNDTTTTNEKTHDQPHDPEDDLPSVSSDSSGEFHRRTERYDVRHDRKQANRIWNQEDVDKLPDPFKRCISGLRNMASDVDGVVKERIQSLAGMMKAYGNNQKVKSFVIEMLDELANDHDAFAIRIRAIRVSRLLVQVLSNNDMSQAFCVDSSQPQAQQTERYGRQDPRGYDDKSYYAPSSLVGSTNYDTRDRYGYDDKSYYAPSSYVGNTKNAPRDRRGYNRKTTSSDESDTETRHKRYSPRRRRFMRAYSSSDEDTRDRRRNRAAGSKY